MLMLRRFINKLGNQSFASVWEDAFGHALNIKEMILNRSICQKWPAKSWALRLILMEF